MDQVEQQRRDRIRDDCTRALLGHGLRTPTDVLAEMATLPEPIAGDRYGDGGVVAELEDEVADLLGMPAAMFLPSGTMAQQIALRIHADDRGLRTVLHHPTAHPALHESEAMQRLHGLLSLPVGPATGPLTLDELAKLEEPAAALLLELPQREIGGWLPTFDEVAAQAQWARDRGAAVHLDGARLWQVGVAWDRPLPEVAGLFDTVYVSFYKDLGAVAGSCLLGEEDVIARARTWRHRHGGTLFGLWPLAASSLAGLRLRLPRMADYRRHALSLAAAVRDLEGVRVTPDPPHTSMLHLLLRGEADVLDEALLRHAERTGIWTWTRVWPSGHPDWQAVELTVGDATLEVSPEELRDLLEAVVSPAT